MSREYASQLVSGLLDFGAIVSSKLGDETKSLLAKLRGDATGDDTHEDVEDCEVWGHAAIDWRPADPDGDGSCEAVLWRRGDELVALATKDRRFQVTVDAGEVAIHALGSSAAVVRLKPGGEVIIESSDIKLGGDSVGDKVALASAVDSRFDAIHAALDAFAVAVPLPTDGGAVIHSAFKVAWPGAPPATPSDVGSPTVTLD